MVFGREENAGQTPPRQLKAAVGRPARGQADRGTKAEEKSRQPDQYAEDSGVLSINKQRKVPRSR